MNGVPTYTLCEAEKQGHAKFLWAVGDGTTVRLRLTMRNLRHYPVAIVVEPGTTFTPRDRIFQEMAVIRPTLVHLKPFETRAIWVNTACLQAGRRAPAMPTEEQIGRRRESLRAQVAAYLRQQGLEAHIEDFVEEHDDGLRARLHDLERIGQALGYTSMRIREIYDELEDMRHREPATVHMGYVLAPVSTERAKWLHCITRTIEQMDTDIARISYLAEQPVANLIRQYGRKSVILELTQRGNTLIGFQAVQYLEHLDSGLAKNVFQQSGRRFQPGESFRLVEFDEYNDPEWRSNPRLNSIVAQYAIWAITDSYGVDECCQRIRRSGRDAALMGAGVCSVLYRAAQVASESGLEAGELERRIPLFAESKMRRILAKVQQRWR